jgi:hypothetical protein
MKKVVRSVIVSVVFFAAMGIVIAAAPANGTDSSGEGMSSLPTVDFIETAQAQATCGSGGYRCGDLETNGTCCNNADKCCSVSNSVGSCYCVSQGDPCNRYR